MSKARKSKELSTMPEAWEIYINPLKEGMKLPSKAYDFEVPWHEDDPEIPTGDDICMPRHLSLHPLFEEILDLAITYRMEGKALAGLRGLPPSDVLADAWIGRGPWYRRGFKDVIEGHFGYQAHSNYKDCWRTYEVLHAAWEYFMPIVLLAGREDPETKPYEKLLREKADAAS
jgi:hypothetical protein